MTQTSGMIVLFGVLAMVPAVLDLIAISGDNVDWNGEPNKAFPPIVGLIANIVVVIFGFSSVFIGFQYLASQWGSKAASTFGLFITLLAWFPFWATVANIGFSAENNLTTGGPLVIDPVIYAPTESEVNGIAVLGILSFYGYAGTVSDLGCALTFLHWKSWKFHSGEASIYNAGYYRSREGYYGFLSCLVGICQMTLGAFIIERFGDGQLPAPIAVGPFFVLFPEISVAVGLSQLLLGFYILARSKTPAVLWSSSPTEPMKDNGLFLFQLVAWFVMIFSITAQVIGQVALHSANGPGIMVVNVIGFGIFPIYLDVMAHTTPEVISEEMYSSVSAKNFA
ncbi:unnamed protein product [Choristocarpus tenellus]